MLGKSSSGPKCCRTFFVIYCISQNQIEGTIHKNWKRFLLKDVRKITNQIT